LEIQQLLVDYSTAIDLRRFDDLDAVFTPDAYIDFWAVKRHQYMKGRAGILASDGRELLFNSAPPIDRWSSSGSRGLRTKAEWWHAYSPAWLSLNLS
jgi:SnoaL-like domain